KLDRYLWHPSEAESNSDESTVYMAESLGDLPGIARKLIQFAGERRHILFTGSLGAGKTTFIKILVEALGSFDKVTSPTFALINEYSVDGGKIYHMDLYRVSSEKELDEFGFDEYLDSGQWCLIEWPQIAESHFESAILVDIKADGLG